MKTFTVPLYLFSPTLFALVPGNKAPQTRLKQQEVLVSQDRGWKSEARGTGPALSEAKAGSVLGSPASGVAGDGWCSQASGCIARSAFVSSWCVSPNPPSCKDSGLTGLGTHPKTSS